MVEGAPNIIIWDCIAASEPGLIAIVEGKINYPTGYLDLNRWTEYLENKLLVMTVFKFSRDWD